MAMEQHLRRKPLPTSVSPVSRSPTPTEPRYREGRASIESFSESNVDERENCLDQPKTTQGAETVSHAAPKGGLSRHFTVSTILGDCAAVLLPLALLGFVIRVWCFDNTEYVEGSLDTWRNAIGVVSFYILRG